MKASFTLFEKIMKKNEGEEIFPLIETDKIAILITLLGILKYHNFVTGSL